MASVQAHSIFTTWLVTIPFLRVTWFVSACDNTFPRSSIFKIDPNWQKENRRKPGYVIIIIIYSIYELFITVDWFTVFYNFNCTLLCASSYITVLTRSHIIKFSCHILSNENFIDQNFLDALRKVLDVLFLQLLIL